MHVAALVSLGSLALEMTEKREYHKFLTLMRLSWVGTARVGRDTEAVLNHCRSLIRRRSRRIARCRSY
jgi:hypothetical protein